MSEHIDIIAADGDPAPSSRAGSPRELAFRTGEPVKPAEPGRHVALVPQLPRMLPWAVRAPGRRAGNGRST